MQKNGGTFVGKAEVRIAAIVAKHSVQKCTSVTRLRRCRLVWQQEPYISTCQVSGRSSQISTYSFATIFLISFGGTEPKPGRWATSIDWLGLAPVAAVTTANGHARLTAGGGHGENWQRGSRAWERAGKRH